MMLVLFFALKLCEAFRNDAEVLENYLIFVTRGTCKMMARTMLLH